MQVVTDMHLKFKVSYMATYIQYGSFRRSVEFSYWIQKITYFMKYLQHLQFSSQ